MKAILAGGSGFLGASLARVLKARGCEVVVLTRGAARVAGGVRFVTWDGRTPEEWTAELNGSSCVINFTGKSVNCIYSEENRKAILRSRIDSVRVLHQAIDHCETAPKLFCQAASLAIYGDTANDCDEESPHGSGFSIEVCEEWEDEFFGHSHPGVRYCLFRIGFVLGRGGGALSPLTTLTRLFLGGTSGSGNQYVSWIHIDDLNAMFLSALDNQFVQGIYNATGPAPVTNRVFMAALRRAVGRPWSPPVPAALVRIGARVVMKTEASLILTGRKCYPKRFISEGFRFQYDDLAITLESLVRST